LAQGLGLIKTAKQVGVGVSVVQRVRGAMVMVDGRVPMVDVGRAEV